MLTMKYGCIHLFLVLMSLNVFLLKDPSLWREIGIWKRMRHECIVPLLGTTTHYSPVSFVSPWMSNGTLNSYLNKGKVSLAVKYSLVGYFSFLVPYVLLIRVSCMKWQTAYTTVSAIC
jgi:hypothetical protein